MIYDPTALQCKNCGLRFSSSQSDSEAYSQHLDWHFRIKRKEKDNAKKAESRRWYFEKVDWIISDEIEDEKGIFITFLTNCIIQSRYIFKVSISA